MRFKGKIFFISLILTFISLNLIGQNDPEKKFIQFVFSNLEAPEKARQVQDFIKGQDGVYMIRANYSSRKFFLIYYATSDINLQKVDDWLEQFELEYKCVNQGIHGVDKVLNQKIDCN